MPIFRRERRGAEAEPPRAISPELAAEFERTPNWMYRWDLGEGRTTPLLSDHLQLIHETRFDMLEGPVRAALAAAGSGASAIDLACSEGWFAHRMLELGASRAVGIDVREQSVRRAELVRDHLGIDPETLAFRTSDVYEVRPEELGTFDVVLLLGLIYHVEDPVGAIRRARALLKPGGICVIESQLTRQLEPIVHTWGTAHQTEIAEASFAARIELDSAINPVASVEGIVSLVPNAVALEQITRAVGFGHVEWTTAREGHDAQYIEGDRAVIWAR